MRLTHEKGKRKSLYGKFTIFYAEKGGGLVLRGERSWKKINGCMVQLKGHRWIFLFRREFKP